MEKLMSLQKYVRQVRPRNESHTSPVDKIQNFLTEISLLSEQSKDDKVHYEFRKASE